ncbi:MAG: proton-conducting transporter membrane subunit [Ardenticatenales bacterium]
MVGEVLLVLTLLLPVAAAFASLRLPPGEALRTSTAVALVLVGAATFAVVDVELPLIAGRALEMTRIAQLGIQLEALAMLGLVMGLHGATDDTVTRWLPVAWTSLAGLAAALLINSLPLGLIAFVAAALLWAFGLPEGERGAAMGAVLRYAALLALVIPLLLSAYRLAELRPDAADKGSIEQLVLSLVVPAFALLLGLIPMHAWVLTLASGAPRTMLFGVLSLVQTAGFALLLRTLEDLKWLTATATAPLIFGGAVSAFLGAWLALSARLEDPDDWLVYAMVANSGMLIVGLGTQSRVAAQGVVLMLFARVLALVLLAVGRRVTGMRQRAASAVALLTLAGTPGLAGFPGLWQILQKLAGETAGSTAPVPFGAPAHLALLAASALLFATALRRWSAPPDPIVASDRPDIGGERAVVVLIGLIVVLGLAPQLVSGAFARALSDMFFQLN